MAVYFDNNATTRASQEVINAVAGVMGGTVSTKKSISQRFRKRLAEWGGFDLEGPQGYTIIFTSGGAEGNAHVLTSAARAYAARTKNLPHIVTSAADHESVLGCCQQLVRDQMIQLTVLPVYKIGSKLAGTVNPVELKRALRANTCLVSITAASGETGALNDVKALGAICRTYKIPFHSDVTQLFARSIVRLVELNLDAVTASFHRLHGPPGVGVLILRNQFVSGYGLGPLIVGPPGTLRGGLENLPGIAGAFVAHSLAVQNRDEKNKITRALRDGILTALADHCRVIRADEYQAAQLSDAATVVWFGPQDRLKILPNTLLLSVLGRTTQPREDLLAAGVIVGAGSADALKSMNAPPELIPGAFRISLSDKTTAPETATLVSRLVEILLRPKPAD